MKRHIIKVPVGDHELQFETGKIAKQAGGAVIVRCGDTMVFTTACASPEAGEGTDFLPLRVDYQEKFSSAGKTLGGFIKREGRPSEKETLMSRLIDRPLRPMFEEGYYNEVQILSYVWSYDGINLPEPLAICSASAALVLSEVPLVKPLGAVRVGLVDSKFTLNPTSEQMKRSSLDLVLAGTEDAILMIEGYCNFLTEDQILEAITLGHEAIKKICEALSNWQVQLGKQKNRDSIRKLPHALFDEVKKVLDPLLGPALRIIDKQKREKAQGEMKKAVNAAFFKEGVEPKYSKNDVSRAQKEIESQYLRKMVLEENLRCDGRNSTSIRPIDVEQSLLPRVHGSSLFTRGETQALAVCTLGGASMAQRFENLDGEGSHKFYLQYSFPPYSVGEVGRSGAPGRREIGHGKLAERGLKPILPLEADFPYTIRLESNITESNGSSSMATVCGGCLAMMDAGIPIKRPVAGIAMGLVLEGDKFTILSDILGIEDSLGDMDFKVTGDHNGVTAFQMDIKVEGITIEIMRQALTQAKQGRIHILEKMLAVVPKSRDQMSSYAPRIETIQIKQSKIGLVVGPGGKMIRSIIEETGVEIDIADTGLISISSPDAEGIEKAKNIILGLVAEVEIGKVYSGKVVSVVAFGAFVEILPGKEGLCHISEYDNQRINDIGEFVKPGDMMSVKVIDINDRGQIKLSRKATLAKKA